MKKILATLLAAFGAGASSPAAPDVQQVNPKAIRFSMPTIAADELGFAVPAKDSFDAAPQFHEDEWCQIEFYPQDRVDEVKRMLMEYKAFEQQHRTEYGWSQIYVRRLARSLVVSGHGAVDDLSRVLGATRLPSPILTTSSRPLGQVDGGFALGIPGSVIVYGLASDSGANALAALVERGGDDLQLTKAFASLSASHGLVLVDWRSQMLLLSVEASGGINVWQP